MQSSVERYKSKIHHMEFKTTELEATLNRKEQIITKLQQNLEEVRKTYSNSFIYIIVIYLFISYHYRYYYYYYYYYYILKQKVGWDKLLLLDQQDGITFVQKKRPLIQLFQIGLLKRERLDF